MSTDRDALIELVGHETWCEVIKQCRGPIPADAYRCDCAASETADAILAAGFTRLAASASPEPAVAVDRRLLALAWVASWVDRLDADHRFFPGLDDLTRGSLALSLRRAIAGQDIFTGIPAAAALDSPATPTEDAQLASVIFTVSMKHQAYAGLPGEVRCGCGWSGSRTADAHAWHVCESVAAALDSPATEGEAQ